MDNLLSFNDFVLFEDENKTEDKKNLFDMNNKLVFRTIKDLRSLTINKNQYTFFCVGSGMEAYAKNVAEKNKEYGDVLSKIASKKDKTLVFTDEGIYIVSEAVFNGIVSLTSSIFSYLNEGSITAGVSVGYTFNRMNIYFNNKGAEPFNNMKEDPSGLFKKVMKELYTLADSSPKASEAVSILTVAAYKSSPTSFKTIPNFLDDCIYKTAKDLNLKSVKVGQNIEDFYKVCSNTLDNLKVPIVKTIEDGMEKLSNIIDKGIRKSTIFGARLNKDSADALKAAQDRIAPTGKIIADKSKHIWNSVFKKNN